MQIKIKDKFPDFQLFNQNNQLRSLKDYQNTWLVIFFYAKDNTSACTSEVISFNDLAPEFHKENVVIIGISRDSVKTHFNFSQKLNLNYELLSDPEREFIQSLGLLKEKKMYGKPVKGTVRSTFILDSAGIVQATWFDVKVPGHAQEVLEKIQKLKT